MASIKPSRITLKMLEAGERAMARCHAAAACHTPQTVCYEIFMAMLAAADIHPGANLARSFEWSDHDEKRPQGQKYTRADFDADGKRLAGMIHGKPHYLWINNYPYLRQYHIKRNTKS